MLWQKIARPLLFCLPAERAHYFSMGVFKTLLLPAGIGRLVRRRYEIIDPALGNRVFGLEFRNPVGLAAGFDKDARWFPQLANLGFSHVEVGTITGQPQPGNPPPRLFRLAKDKALINRMGFNNGGSDAAARRLARTRKSKPTDILGVNIGKTKIVPVEEATRDYLFSFERLFDYADYFTINVSSPNTPGLRTLQNREPLIELLAAITELNRKLAVDHECQRKPVLLKIAPDLTDPQLADIVLILKEVRLDGIIATNTTLSRADLKTPPTTLESIGAGGLSGAPLTQRSRQIVKQLFDEFHGEIPIIGVGGIMDGEHAWQMILAGASLIQIYTGFIYGGPTIVRDINRYVLNKLKQHGLSSVSEAVGGGQTLL
jgi:dihydroorotate dehydrogenase